MFCGQDSIFRSAGLPSLPRFLSLIPPVVCTPSISPADPLTLSLVQPPPAYGGKTKVWTLILPEPTVQTLPFPTPPCPVHQGQVHSAQSHQPGLPSIILSIGCPPPPQAPAQTWHGPVYPSSSWRCTSSSPMPKKSAPRLNGYSLS